MKTWELYIINQYGLFKVTFKIVQLMFFVALRIFKKTWNDLKISFLWETNYVIFYTII